MNAAARTAFSSLVLGLSLACASTVEPDGADPPSASPGAPPRYADGFDREGSDPRAIELAERVVARVGGRAGWGATELVHWNFLGHRRWIWDRANDRARVEVPGDALVVVCDLPTRKGRAWRGGSRLTGDELAEKLELAHQWWVNDSYWLAMPFKLFDPGVTLSHAGRRTAADGRQCEVLRLAFSGVGYTPENHYDVYVDSDTDLIAQWDFYASGADDEPRMSTPWRDWQRHGEVWFSADRGELELTEIRVFDVLPAAVFSSPIPFEPEAHARRADPGA